MDTGRCVLNSAILSKINPLIIFYIRTQIKPGVFEVFEFW